MFRTIRKKLFRLAIVSGAGAAANYFFDRDRGEQRRADAKEKATSLMGKASGGASWQPGTEQAANGFEPQVVSASSTPTTPASPTVSDVISEPTPAAGVQDPASGSASTRPVGS